MRQDHFAFTDINQEQQIRKQKMSELWIFLIK